MTAMLASRLVTLQIHNTSIGATAAGAMWMRFYSTYALTLCSEAEFDLACLELGAAVATVHQPCVSG